MNFRRYPIFVHISDINKQINEHERLVLVCKDKTAAFGFKKLDIGTLFYRKRVSGGALSEQQLSASFDEKRRYFLQCLTDYLLQMSGSDLSKVLFYYTSKMFLDYVDLQKKNFDLSNLPSVIDAYRIESAPSQMQTALSATYVGGYRIGMIVSGAGALYLADFFGSNEAAYSYAAWQKTYLIMAAVMLIAVATTLFIREPKYAVKKEHMNSTSDNLRLLVVFALSVIGFIFTYVQVGGVLPETDSVGLGFLYGVVRFISSGIVMGVIGYALVEIGLVAKSVATRAWVMPIRDFFERYGKKALLVLALIGLYRISDIVAGNISNIFYQDLGFTKTQIANAVKVVGVIAAIGGGFVGGWIAQKTGVMRAMMIGALLACATNLLFILLFYTPTSFMMYMAVITDNLAAGLASAVFIAFLSALTSIRFTAVQYALFSSLMTLSPKILGGYSGAIVDATNYPVFFAITFVIGIPILLLVYLVNKHITIEEPVIKK